MKRFIKYSLVFLFVLNGLNTSYCQQLNETTLLKAAFIHPSQEKKFSYAYKNRNEIQTFFAGMFLFYKFCISSQDIPSVCSFSPSCSEYGLLSVKKYGPFIGMMNTFDRLTRCNGLNDKNYIKDEITGRLADEP